MEPYFIALSHECVLTAAALTAATLSCAFLADPAPATQRALQDDPAALLKRSRPRAEDLMHIFVNQTRYLTEFLEHMVTNLPDASPVLYNTLLELYLKQVRIPETRAFAQSQSRAHFYGQL